MIRIGDIDRAHDRLSYLSTARTSLAVIFLAIYAGACAVSGARHSAPAESQHIEPGDSPAQALDVARAAGERVRHESPGGFVVYPVYLNSGGSPPSPMSDSLTMARLLDAFRISARTDFEDLSAVSDSSRRATLSISQQYYFTLDGPPVISGNSAIVDVFGGRILLQYAPIESQLFRYTFVRSAGTVWRFVNRKLLYAT